MKRETVYQKGQKFTSEGLTFTALSFYSDDGKEYESLVLCKANAKTGWKFYVKNVEYGGATILERSYLI